MQRPISTSVLRKDIGSSNTVADSKSELMGLSSLADPDESDPLNRAFTEEDLEEDGEDRAIARTDSIVPEELSKPVEDRDEEANELIGTLDEIFESSVPTKEALFASSLPWEPPRPPQTSQIRDVLVDLKTELRETDPLRLKVSKLLDEISKSSDQSEFFRASALKSLGQILDQPHLPSRFGKFLDKNYPEIGKALAASSSKPSFLE